MDDERLSQTRHCSKGVGYWTTRRYANSRTSQLVDWTSRGYRQGWHTESL